MLRLAGLRPVMAATFLLLLTGTGQAADVQPQRGGTLTLVINYEPPALVALTTVATPALSVSAKVTEGLLSYDYDLNPQPQLATAWEISPDGTRYTFHLRQGVKWHDGRDFTSADVAWSIDLLKKVHPRGSSTFANVTAIETPDPHTAVIVLSKPAPYLIKAFAAAESPIVPRHLYEGQDPLTNPHNGAPIGTGPYVFDQWVRGSHVLYKRNPHYWQPGRPYLDQLVVKFIPDAAARSLAFETNAADLGYRSPVALSDMARLKALPQLGFETKGNSYSYNVSSLQFNLDDEHFRDLRVRQAVAHAINRDIVLQVAYFGLGKVSTSPIAPGITEYHDASPSPYAFDIERANALLDEAGYRRGADGVRFKVALDYNPIAEDLRKTAEYLRSSLAKIGIGVTLRSQDLSTFVRRVYTNRDFAFTVNGHSNLFDPTVGVQRIYWSKNFRKGVPFSNASHYHNPEVDRLLETAQTENDPARRVQQFQRFQQIVGQELPDVSLVSPEFITIYNRRVHDHSVTADGVEGNLAEVWLAKP
ncbi:ABC transporter substrate-binding protein [Brenneria tiliae]|uniref:ABC transporter substrate-binding protein n=1 Tax=Brenneria tiliae TaxID=2914984 RepID=UPI002014B243|nr:ABC transporter substrate-binding protein [Brenneria tiliae]MCL2899089.1 ABC transporter substrate-binding protein [Brenneria tiliae]MCL2903467.1 ABC transporter substrate-binding protein [Brenneria tiliae]